MSVNRKSGSTLQPLTLVLTMPSAIPEASITEVRVKMSLGSALIIDEVIPDEDWSVSGVTLTAQWYESDAAPLAAGKYKAELWVSTADGVLKAPSKSYAEVNVNASLDD